MSKAQSHSVIVVQKRGMTSCHGHHAVSLFQVRNEFYKDSQGVILVYDVGLRESFDALDSWLAEMKQEMGSQANMESIVFVVCANKVRWMSLCQVWNWKFVNVIHY